MASTPIGARTRPIHDDPEQSYTLPSTYYTDPAIYEQEKEEIFFKTWQLVGYGPDLREAGDYVAATILDQPVFVVRAKDGDLRAYYNVCMHRGHILLEGTGNVRMITCPFHAWTYDLDGNLKAAGNSENVAGFEHADFCLPEIQIEEFANMAFVNLDPTAPSLASQAAGLEQDMRDAIPRFDELKFGRRDRFEIRSNWKAIQDQNNECYHCPHIHKGVGIGSRGQAFWESTEGEIWARHLVRPVEADPQDAHADLPFEMRSGDIEQVYLWFLWPNMFFVAHRGPSNLKIMHFRAEAADFTIETIDALCVNDPPDETDIAAMDYFTKVAVPQDNAAMEKVQQGLYARGYTQGRLIVDAERSIRSEHGTHQFDKLVWDALHRGQD